MPGWLLGYEAALEFLSARDLQGNLTPIMAWASEQNESLYLSEFTWATLRGMAEQESSPRQRQEWLKKLDHDVLRDFAGTILPVNRDVLKKYSVLIGDLAAHAKKTNTAPLFDEHIEISTALQHELVYVTPEAGLAQQVGCRTFWP